MKEGGHGINSTVEYKNPNAKLNISENPFEIFVEGTRHSFENLKTLPRTVTPQILLLCQPRDLATSESVNRDNRN